MRRWHGASVNARAEGDNYESPRTTSRASVIERGPPPAALNESLPDVHIPMTFVHAGSSQMPVSANADTAARLPHADLMVVDNAGHFPWFQQPGSVRHALDQLVARTRGNDVASV